MRYRYVELVTYGMIALVTLLAALVAASRVS